MAKLRPSQRFFAAPVTICNEKLTCLWTSFCNENTLKWPVRALSLKFGLRVKKSGRFVTELKNLRVRT